MTLKRKVLNALFIIFALSCFFQSSVFAKDEWIMVNSKNFKLIGNASDRDIRSVATKLEQFREVFRLIFSGVRLDSTVPTNVIVFKNNSAYKPFKPKRADGKIDDFIAGYFQSGEDANYITLSTEGEDDRTFEVIFHEYVHFLVNTNIGKSKVPTWFNEGLAEYYSTFAIENDQRIKLGIFKQNHLALIAQNKLMSLDSLFAVSNYELHQQGNHSRSIFYAESWALIHYMMQNGKSAGLNKFLQMLMKDVPPQQAFQDSFQINYASMEKELGKYVSQNSYKYNYLDLKNKLVFENEMQTSPLSEAAADSYLGDLLFHLNRVDDAEEFLQKSISLDDKQSAAYTTLGMVRFRQGKFDEARNYLEKALVDDQKNPIALYYYAYVLSRADGNNLMARFSAETSTKMREALKKSIALNPTFGGSYDLLAYVNLASNENLDESLELLRQVLRTQPGNQRYTLRIAEIYLRQEKFDLAKVVAEKIAGTTDEPEIRSRAEILKDNIQRMQQSRADYDAARKKYEENGGYSQPLLNRQEAPEKKMTPEEVAKLQENATMISLNQALRKAETGEKQVLGHITKIACVGGKITYTVKTDKETLAVFSKDFQSLALVALTPEGNDAQVGCNADIAKINAVITYKESAAQTGLKGELVAVDFVPDNFRFIER